MGNSSTDLSEAFRKQGSLGESPQDVHKHLSLFIAVHRWRKWLSPKTGKTYGLCWIVKSMVMVMEQS